MRVGLSGAVTAAPGLPTMEGVILPPPVVKLIVTSSGSGMSSYCAVSNRTFSPSRTVIQSSLAKMVLSPGW